MWLTAGIAENILQQYRIQLQFLADGLILLVGSRFPGGKVYSPIGQFITKFLQRFRESTLVDQAFYGLRPASAALIAAAGVSVVKIALLDLGAFAASHAVADLFAWKAIVLAVVVWVLTNVVKPTKKLHPLFFIALSAVAGILFRFGGA